MRFSESGPQIPDALLRARDEGRVVFFCGAGVSQARAGLTDFIGLAKSVIRVLGAPADSDASKVLRMAEKVGNKCDVTGLISAADGKGVRTLFQRGRKRCQDSFPESRSR